ETMGMVLARLWLVSPDRDRTMRETKAQLRTATDVLRVACVLMGGNPSLALPMRLGSIERSLRRVVLDALEQMALEDVVEEMIRHRTLWKSVGYWLHPFVGFD